MLRLNKMDVDSYLEILTPLLRLTEENLKRFRKESKRLPPFIPILLKDNIPWIDVATIELGLLDIPGVSIEESTHRVYLFGENLSHLIGYVGLPNESECAQDKDLLDIRVGKSGLEKVFNLTLRGEPGLRKVEVNARGRPVRDLSQDNPIPGRDIYSTIDLDLQQRLMEDLSKFPSAAGVLMNVNSGEILALGSQPSYDPHLFSEGISQKEWKNLQKNPFTPLINKAIGGLYAPGSPFKMCVALAALEKGVIDEHTATVCAGYTLLGQHRFHCWRKESHGRLTIKDAFKHSCDIYFYEAGRRVGIDAIAEMATRLGIGVDYQLGLSGEKKGHVPSKAWKLKKFHQPWYLGETYNVAIGQGYVLTTPLELAVMTARLVNGGKCVVPRLSLGGDSVSFDLIGVQEKYLHLILEGMGKVCNEPGGTAYRARIQEPGFFMGGKTGTSQVRRITMSERAQGVRKTHQLDWKLRNHALFVGFAPFDCPQYVASILIEHGGDGVGAAPIAQRLLLAAQKKEMTRG